MGLLDPAPGRHRHLCAFFNSRDDEYRTLLPLILQGISAGERAFHIVDPDRTADHRVRLTEAGVDLPAVERSGQLELVTWREAQLGEGRFEHERTVAAVQHVLDEGHRRFPSTRLLAHMEWVLEGQSRLPEIVQYESRLNEVLPCYDDILICIYDARRFKGDLVVAMMRAHPLMMVGGVIYENPFCEQAANGTPPAPERR
jgi:hypothetical protein